MSDLELTVSASLTNKKTRTTITATAPPRSIVKPFLPFNPAQESLVRMNSKTFEKDSTSTAGAFRSDELDERQGGDNVSVSATPAAICIGRRPPLGHTGSRRSFLSSSLTELLDNPSSRRNTLLNDTTQLDHVLEFKDENKGLVSFSSFVGMIDTTPVHAQYQEGPSQRLLRSQRVLLQIIDLALEVVQEEQGPGLL